MAERPNDGATVPSLWPYLVLCAGVAAWVDLGRLHGHHHGDSLVPVLVSLYRWTFFFWDSDHVGMLVPLLASPIKSPLANLLVQCGVNAFCGLSAFFLLARYVVRDRSYPVVGALGVAGFLALAPNGYGFDYLIATLYGVALALGLGGLALLVPRADGRTPAVKVVSAFGLFVLAHWVYAATAVALAPLVVFRAAFDWAGRRDLDPDARLGPRLLRLARSEAVVAVSLLGAALVAGMAMMRLSPGEHAINNATLPPSLWTALLGEFASNTWAALAPQHWPWALGASAVVGLTLLLVPAVRRQAPSAGAAVPLVLAAACQFVYMGTRAYIRSQTYHPRYLMFAVLYVQAALLVVAVAPACAAMGRRGLRVAYALTVPLLFLAAFWGYGRPSLSGVRADLDRTLGGRTADVVGAGCTHVAGDFWTVWPTVFHANLVLHDRGERRVVWGVAHNSLSTSRRWKRTPAGRIRVAAVPKDADLARALFARFGYESFAAVEDRPTVRVFRPTVAAPQVAAGSSGRRE